MWICLEATELSFKELLRPFQGPVCIGKAQAGVHRVVCFVKMEVNHFHCTLLKLFFVSMLACLLHYVDVFETF